MQKILFILLVGFSLSACQATQQQIQEAALLCQDDFGVPPGTPNFDNCKKWVLHYHQTGVESNYPEFVCQSIEGDNHQSCITRQQAVYKEMMRVSEAVEAQRDKEFELQKKEAARKAQEEARRIEQADHQKCVSYGFRKGTKAYVGCREQIEQSKVAAIQAEIQRQQEQEETDRLTEMLQSLNQNQQFKTNINRAFGHPDLITQMSIANGNPLPIVAQQAAQQGIPFDYEAAEQNRQLGIIADQLQQLNANFGE